MGHFQQKIDELHYISKNILYKKMIEQAEFLFIIEFFIFILALNVNKKYFD